VYENASKKAAEEQLATAAKRIPGEIRWVWLLWNDGPGGVEAALVLCDMEFPVGIEIS